MTQTSRPCRWTRNRPRDDSILSRILEKERLASVADTRSSRVLSDPVFSDFIATTLIVQRLPQQVNSAFFRHARAQGDEHAGERDGW